jgi:DNA-binding response OmpR family regulator
MPKRIDILDDDAEFCELLSAALRNAGYAPVSYGSAGRLLDAVLKKPPSLLIIDVNLPGMDGREIPRILRRNPATQRLPVILVSGTTSTSDEITKAFQNGADEYLVKPFGLDLFLLRVSSLLQRAEGGASADPEEILKAGPLAMFTKERAVSVSGRPVRMTRLEFDLLEYFLRNRGRVITRALLLEEVWKMPIDTTSRTVDKYVQYLRAKLRRSGYDGSIETVVNIGYMFAPRRRK